MPTGEEWDRASCHKFTSPPGTEYLKYSLLQDAQYCNIPVEITGSGGATFVQRSTYIQKYSANIELSSFIAKILLLFGLGTRKSQIECHYHEEQTKDVIVTDTRFSVSVITMYSKHVSRVMTRPRWRSEAGRGGRYIIHHQVFNQSVPPGCHRRRRTR